ncbi:MAG: cysteine desulfurase family protein [Planctomycetota bacterium]
MIYLDHNSTTPPLPEVIEAVRAAFETDWANPSSVHRAGQAARRVVELARQDVAALLGMTPREIVFTASGTESIDFAIRGVLAASGRRVLVTDDAEHAAVRDLAAALAFEGVEVLKLPLSEGGVVDAEALPALLSSHDVGLVSVQWANNETGTIQPIAEIHGACRAAGVPFHCDGTQWVGKMPVDKEAPFDLLTCSAHKLHGPKGVGVLAARRGIRMRPVIHGAQELGRRGGTENVPGIAGFGAAAKAAAAWLADSAERERLAELRYRFERAVLEACPGAVVNGPAEPGARLWNTTNIGFPRLEAEVLLLAMSERGLCASAGAACSSGSLDPSPVLLAMGIAPEIAHGSIRFSLSRFTTEAEIDGAIEVVRDAVARVGGLGL